MQTEIGTLKEGLVVERKKRYNKEIYEETCKDINTYPPHKATKVCYMITGLRDLLDVTVKKDK